MLTYSFTNLKNESLYMHLYQCIRQDIVDGKLVSGEKLPSKRSFAKNIFLKSDFSPLPKPIDFPPKTLYTIFYGNYIVRECI